MRLRAVVCLVQLLSHELRPWVNVTLETGYLPIPPNLQWGDRLKVAAIHRSAQNGGQMESERSLWPTETLESSQTHGTPA